MDRVRTYAAGSNPESSDMPSRYLCAPDSFKGCLSAAAAANAMAAGIRRVAPTGKIDLCPIADGGEGTVEALVHATGGEFCNSEVSDPLGRPIQARWGWLGSRGTATAIIEMAAASGLTLLAKGERNPLRTTTLGTGQLIAAAIDAGARRVMLGLGGSATNDGGCGAAMALGVRFFTAADQEIETPIRGGDLAGITRVDTSNLALGETSIVICRDVDNPLAGPTGAAAVYAAQKGASVAQIRQPDHGLARPGVRSQAHLGVAVTPLDGARVLMAIGLVVSKPG